jgi:transposase
LRRRGGVWDDSGVTPHADNALPEDPAALAVMVAALRGELAEERTARRIAELGLQAKTLEAERLRVQIARLRHERFGRSSERLAGEVEQLELRLDEVLADIAASGGADDAEDEAASAKAPEEKARRRGRKPLPDSLPRRDVEHLPAEGCACRACGGALRKVGEDVTEILEYRPGRFEVVRHVRPAFSCRTCEAMTQAPMPSLPIERGRPGPGLLAHVLVSKYCDHLPLYRQSEIYARDGLDLPRGLLAGWVGKSAALAEPMAAYIGCHALAGPRVHADDTPMPMLSPGRGRTQAARFWAYLRDDRPFGGRDPPAVFYEFTSDRKGEHPQRRLRDFRGILQADAYAGFNALYESGRVVEAACWTHARRYFHDELLANGSPLAREAIERMQPRFAVEAEILAGGDAAADLRQVGPGQGHPLRAGAVGRADDGAARRPRLPAQQRRRAAHAPARSGPEELPVRRVARRRQAGRYHLHPRRHRGAQRLGSAGLSARPAGSHRRPPDQPHRRTRTLEPEARRRLSRVNAITP